MEDGDQFCVGEAPSLADQPDLRSQMTRRWRGSGPDTCPTRDRRVRRWHELGRVWTPAVDPLHRRNALVDALVPAISCTQMPSSRAHVGTTGAKLANPDNITILWMKPNADGGRETPSDQICNFGRGNRFFRHATARHPLCSRFPRISDSSVPAFGTSSRSMFNSNGRSGEGIGRSFSVPSSNRSSSPRSGRSGRRSSRSRQRSLDSACSRSRSLNSRTERDFKTLNRSGWY